MGEITAEELAKQFHELYEELAPHHGWETQESSRVPWEELPMNNRMLMTMVCRIILMRIRDGKIRI